MKHFIKYFSISIFLIFSSDLLAEEKIAILDLKFVLNESKAGKGAQDFLKKSFNDNAKKFADIEKSLKKEESDLLGKKNILSKEEYTKKSDSLRKKVIDYQSQRRSSLDKIATQRAKSREALMKKIEPIVDTYIKENNISIVMDKKNMIGGLTEYDITQVIIDKLDKVLPSLKLE